jgi:hypothetical protein
MSVRRTWLFTALGLTAVVSACLVGSAAFGTESNGDRETSVTSDQLPDSVRGVYEKFASAGTVEGFVREESGEDAAYTGQVTIGGGSFELKLDGSGKVLEVEKSGTEDASDDNGDDSGESEGPGDNDSGANED